jgi:hypothetical protein
MILASVEEDNSVKSWALQDGGFSNGLVTRFYKNRHTQISLKKRSRTDKTKHRKTTGKMEGPAYSSRG